MEQDISWPDDLIESIARREVVFFIGSGVSSTSVNDKGERLPGWSGYISKILSKVPHCDIPEWVRPFIEKELEQGNNLMALQALQANLAHKADYFKELRETFSGKGFKPSKAHKILANLNGRLYLTTNFDNILDRVLTDKTDAITLKYNQESAILEHIRTDETLLIKVHGDLVEQGNLIFTKSEFYKAMRDHPYFYEILKSIFSLYTILFIGYSAQDPDINLLMSKMTNNLNKTSPNYILLPEHALNEVQKEDLINNFNLDTIYYPAKNATDHANFVDALQDLNELTFLKGINMGINPTVNQLNLREDSE